MTIRKAAVAGTWYPGTAPRSRRPSIGYLAGTGGEAADHLAELVALIAPHAGLMYSGPVAAHAYRLLRDRSVRRRRARRAVALRRVRRRVDLSRRRLRDAARRRRHRRGVRIGHHGGRANRARAPAAHAREHSLEMQLPFLKRVAPAARIVPLVMGRQTAETARALGDALGAVLDGRNALLVASTDLSHYHDAATAARLDAVVIDHVSRFDADGLQRALDAEPEHACGGGPTVAVMRAARHLGARDAVILKYADSGDVSGDKSAVVGYLAAALGNRQSRVSSLKSRPRRAERIERPRGS